MKEYQKVRSTVKPEPVVIDDYSVWVAENITEVKEEATGDAEIDFEGYEYDLTQYIKDEYIQMISEKNASLGTQAEATQEALDFLLLGVE